MLKKILKNGASENHLKNIDVSIPLGTFTCVTGVSGSGKSSLIMSTLAPAAREYVDKSKVTIGKNKKIDGLKNIDKIVCSVDYSFFLVEPDFF